MLVLETQLPDPCLDPWALLPPRLVGLVSPHVDEPAGEELHHLGEHILKKRDRGVTGVEDVAEHAPVRRYLGRFTTDAEPRIGGDGRAGMTRHLDLGHHVHELLPSVFHDLAYILLGIETSVPNSVVLPQRRVGLEGRNHGFLPPGTNLGEPGIFPDLDPPALIVGQVPVKAVHLMEREEIDVLLDEVERHEMTNHIKVGATPSETRAILDPDRRHSPFYSFNARVTQDFRRQQLSQRLNAVERSRRSGGSDLNSVPRRLQSVALLAQPLESGVAPQTDPGERDAADFHPEAITRGGFEIIGQLRGQFGRSTVGPDDGSRLQRECTVTRAH